MYISFVFYSKYATIVLISYQEESMKKTNISATQIRELISTFSKAKKEALFVLKPVSEGTTQIYPAINSKE